LAVETALAFLRALSRGRAITPVTLIYGPQSFLREYVLDSLRGRLSAEGFQYRTCQVATADSYSELVSELEGADLFARKRLIAGRVLRSYRERGDDDPEVEERSAPGSGDEAALIAACARIDDSVRLALLYERDKLPARIRRATEQSGTLVNCMRPFDNQLPEYAELFARALQLRLTRKEADLLITRHSGDLAGITNALNKAAVMRREDGETKLVESGGPGAVRIPELFEIAESLAQRGIGETLALFDHAIQTGRDPIEVLALEIIPQVRRMLLAAALLARKKDPASLGNALGVAPGSPLATRAIEGARRFGLRRLERIHQRACELDVSFKNGTIKEREQAVTALMLELAGPEPRSQAL
jgi:DNA polymerase III delta subunit